MNEIEAVGTEAALGPSDAPSPVSAPERPWLFGFLIAPSAVVANGIIQGGVLSFLLRQQGVGIGRSSHIIWLLSLPTTLYFLWCPITDFFVRRRTWLLIGTIGAGALMTLAFRSKDLTSTGPLVLMFFSACFGQLVVSSCGGMMGALHTERAKRVAGSAYQGGALAFGAGAVFVLVMVSQQRGRHLLALIVAALIVVPGLFALFAPRQPLISYDSLARTTERIWTEFRQTFLHWRALPYTLIMLFPLATGAAMGLLPGIAQDFGVSGWQVAWMNGLAGALLMAAGSICASLIPARIRASVAYLTVSLVNAGTLVILWLGPERPATYFLSVALYLFTIGAGYAMFTAVVLEFLGHSGKSGSGRYSIINSLGNVPVLYMTAFDGWGGSRWGARGLPATEAVMGALAAVILLAYFLRSHPTPPEPQI